MSQIEAALRERAAEMLTAYCELVKMTGTYAEMHYLPSVEHVIEQLRAVLSQQSPAPSAEWPKKRNLSASIRESQERYERDVLWNNAIDLCRAAALASPAPSVEPPDQVHLAQSTNEGKESGRAASDGINLADLRRVMREWHDAACRLGYDGVSEVLATAKPYGRSAQWISVADRMPEQFVEVLIAFRDIDLPCTGQYTASPHDTWGWCFPSENDPEDTGPITHWMPLPAAPIAAVHEPEARDEGHFAQAIGGGKESGRMDSLALYKRVCDIWAEANAVDTVIGRPAALMAKLTALRDELGALRTAYIYPAATPASIPQATARQDEPQPGRGQT